MITLLLSPWIFEKNLRDIMRLSQMLLNLLIRSKLHLIKVEGSHPELRATEDLLRVRAKNGLQLPPFDLLGAAIGKVLLGGSLPS